MKFKVDIRANITFTTDNRKNKKNVDFYTVYVPASVRIVSSASSSLKLYLVKINTYW